MRLSCTSRESVLRSRIFALGTSPDPSAPRFVGTFRASGLNTKRERQTGATMEPTDDDLIAACAAGDREAFACLYRRRRPDVYRFALHMTGSRPAAEDIAQDVFLTVIRDAYRYRVGEAGCVPWLLGIARNY